jgi:hypothetical protein
VMNVPSPTQRLPSRAGLKTCSYNRSFLSGAAPPCLAILFGIARGVARHLNSLLPPSRAARVGCRPGLGHVCPARITVLEMNRRSRGR